MEMPTMNDARDLDDRRYREETIGSTHIKSADREHLTVSLHTSIEAARSLANYYDNLAKTLEALVDQLESSK
jgi:hypothetical protein